MANLDFYALEEDQRKLVRFLFDETDVVIYELYSEFDRTIRCFRSLAELEAVFTLGVYQAAYLQLWSPSVMVEPVIRRIELAASTRHTFRYAVGGSGLIQLYLDGMKEGVIHHTHYGHWNEAGARRQSIHFANDCDWRALSKLSGRIQRHIRGLAVARLRSRPVLRHALAAVQDGAALEFGGQTHHANSPDIDGP
jgi:hypothetical protein